jgi:hypothetical protein
VNAATYAAWWEAYELLGAQETEAAIRSGRNTLRDPDEGAIDMTSGMNRDEALAVLRQMAAEELEADAYGVVHRELIALRVQRQDALDLAKELEQKAWSDGGDHAVRAIVRALREALGATP